MSGRIFRGLGAARNGDESGNIVLVLLVMLVSTGLVVGLLQVSYTGLRVSRRSGDTANALEVADAGINDAARRISTATGTSFTGSVSLGTAGSYTYTATLEVGASVWHLDSTGKDPTGAKRRIKADAKAEGLFVTTMTTNALFMMSSGSTADSFSNGSSAQGMCTRHGIVGTNDSANFSFGSNGSGTAVRNCTQTAYGVTWPYAADGCVAYGDGTQAMPPTGTGSCPPAPDSVKIVPKFPMPAVPASTYSDLTLNTNPTVCDSTHPIIGGYRYYLSSLTMRGGCYVDTTLGRAIIFTNGNVVIGNANGASGTVDAPPSNRADLCGTQPSGLKDPNNNPAYYYCPGWAANLQIYMVGGGGSMSFQNHAQFWGVIYAPQSAVLNGGSGTPQVEVWGSIVANSSSSNAQFSFHYDDSLAGLATNGLYDISNWREEPV